MQGCADTYHSLVGVCNDPVKPSCLESWQVVRYFRGSVAAITDGKTFFSQFVHG